MADKAERRVKPVGGASRRGGAARSRRRAQGDAGRRPGALTWENALSFALAPGGEAGAVGGASEAVSSAFAELIGHRLYMRVVSPETSLLLARHPAERTPAGRSTHSRRAGGAAFRRIFSSRHMCGRAPWHMPLRSHVGHGPSPCLPAEPEAFDREPERRRNPALTARMGTRPTFLRLPNASSEADDTVAARTRD
ncbi:hypothetical protein GCM10022227_14960 [Streptomyces sedi]